jgi:hypothetical protein
MSGSTKQTTNQRSNTNQTSSIDPAVLAMQKANFGNAQNIAAQLGQPYTGSLTASFDGTPLSQAQSGFQALAGFQAPQVAGSTYTPTANLTAGQLSSTDLSPYLNPFTSDVANATAAQLARQNNIDNTDAAAKATAAGAFGGSRSAVLQNLNTDSYQRNLDQTLANLNLTGFQNAQQAALSDIANRLTAGNANQNALNTAGQFNAGQTQSAANANQAAALSGAGIRGQANAQLGNIAQQQYGANVGDIQRAYNAWLAQQQGLLSGQSILDASLGQIQAPTTTTGQSQSNGTTETTQTPGLGQILGGLGSLAMGIGTGGLGFAPFAAGAAGAAGGYSGLASLGKVTARARAPFPSVGQAALQSAQDLGDVGRMVGGVANVLASPIQAFLNPVAGALSRYGPQAYSSPALAFQNGKLVIRPGHALSQPATQRMLLGDLNTALPTVSSLPKSGTTLRAPGLSRNGRAGRSQAPWADRYR